MFSTNYLYCIKEKEMDERKGTGVAIRREMKTGKSTTFGNQLLLYEGRTESHEQLFFCMRTGNSRRRRVRW